MTLTQPTPLVKLCQILDQGNPDVNGKPQTIIYQEDCNGNVLVGPAQYPITVQCEVIEFVSQDEFIVRGKINSFNNVTVSLSAPVAGKTLRQAVYEQLLASYPALVI